MRLFIAIEVPVEELRHLQSRLKTSDAVLRLVKDFHLTLRFIGEVQPELTEKIKHLLTKVSFKQIKATLGSIGVFPTEGSPRVVWVSLEPKDAFKQLHEEIDTSLYPLLPKDERFESHVTIARVKNVQNRKLFIEKLHLLKPQAVEFTVNRFYLIKSTLTREGPVYEHVQEYHAQVL